MYDHQAIPDPNKPGEILYFVVKDGGEPMARCGTEADAKHIVRALNLVHHTKPPVKDITQFERIHDPVLRVLTDIHNLLKEQFHVP